MSELDITVVIPAYRAEKWIARSIQSVLDQPDVTPEVIVVEDGVFDDTRSVTTTQFPCVKLITLTENQGVATARNAGLAAAEASFVLFLDSDDFIEGPLLKGLVNALIETNSDLAFGPFKLAGNDNFNNPVWIPSPITEIEWIIGWLETEPWASSWCGRIAWRAKSLRAAGGWREDITKKEDDEIMVRCLSSGFQMTTSTDGVGVYWQHTSPERRISMMREEVWPSLAQIHDLIRVWIESTHYTEANMLENALAFNCYKMAKKAFSRGELTYGRKFLEDARNLGVKGHYGNIFHRFLASILGLENKQKLKFHISR